MITCRGCSTSFPLDKFPHRCPNCGDLFGFQEGLSFSADQVEPDLPGIWRYRHSFSLPNEAPVVTLGEGDTPLVWSQVFGKQVGFKMESLNPTGSFKDRGTAVLVSWLIAAGIRSAVEDSSGNAGASFAAYASRSGIRGKIFIPSYASGPKRFQIESYGAEVIAVPGPRSNAAQAVLREVEEGAVYASHAYLPQGTAGIATIAYELFHQLGKSPGTILVPVGHGSLLLGIALGFQALLAGGTISQLPRLVGIQAAACSPLWEAFEAGQTEPAKVQEGKTLAEGVAISVPYHGRDVLKAVARSSGEFVVVEESDILSGQKELASRGIHVELTSALVWSALEQISPQSPEPIIGILTGHGLKNS